MKTKILLSLVLSFLLVLILGVGNAKATLYQKTCTFNVYKDSVLKVKIRNVITADWIPVDKVKMITGYTNKSNLNPNYTATLVDYDFSFGSYTTGTQTGYSSWDIKQKNGPDDWRYLFTTTVKGSRPNVVMCGQTRTQIP